MKKTFLFIFISLFLFSSFSYAKTKSTAELMKDARKQMGEIHEEMEEEGHSQLDKIYDAISVCIDGLQVDLDLSGDMFDLSKIIKELCDEAMDMTQDYADDTINAAVDSVIESNEMLGMANEYLDLDSALELDVTDDGSDEFDIDAGDGEIKGKYSLDPDLIYDLEKNKDKNMGIIQDKTQSAKDSVGSLFSGGDDE
jgi:hypothetical protein